MYPFQEDIFVVSFFVSTLVGQCRELKGVKSAVWVLMVKRLSLMLLSVSSAPHMFHSCARKC